MTLRLVIEHSTHPQRLREMRHPGGEFSIGRGAECSWQLDDPDMYVSRKHCVITGEAGRFLVTDASRGGLFIDGKDTPLGPGNSAALEQGMRLRLGDVVIRVEIEQAAAAPTPRTAAPRQNRIDGDDFFSRPVTPPQPVRRPEGLPQPFDSGTIDARHSPASTTPSPPPPMFDDPFTLDRTTPARPPAGIPDPVPAQTGDYGFGKFFDEPARSKPSAPPPADDWGLPPAATSTRAPAAPMDDWGLSAPATPEPLARGTRTPVPESDRDRVRERVLAPEQTPRPAPELSPEPAPEPKVEASASDLPAPAPQPVVANLQTNATVPGTDDALRAAFFKGLGLDPVTLPQSGSAQELEALGARFRLLVEGLMLMMRSRAKEKQNARVAQTIIGSADVNPLKFLASTDDVMAALISPKGPGYLPPDEAINGAFRDLADHQMRTWVAMQSALRRMIDRFDPAAIERELVETGMIQALLAGGRNAKLWQLYNDRYKDIARAAEDRFLGEVGADFRDAYEGNRRKTNET